MINYLKNILSYLSPVYNLIKKIKVYFNQTKIFYTIEVKNNNLQLSNNFNHFNKKNINKIKNFNKASYIFLSDKNYSSKLRLEMFKKLSEKIKNSNSIVVYDGNCKYNSLIISIDLLQSYSKLYDIELFPYRFFYFYNKFKFQIENIGDDHFIFNFNGTFTLPNGGRTIGDGGPVDWRLKFIPDLTNKTFLDIGTEEGYSAFHAIKMNAKFATGLNIHEKDEYDYFPNYLRPKQITPRNREEIEKTQNYLKNIYKVGSEKINFEYKNIYNLKDERFDFVFCFGVLYHLKDPYTAIENLYNITNEVLVIETQGAYSYNKEENYAIIREQDGFVRHSSEALKFLLLRAGFKKVDVLFSGVNRVKIISNIVLRAMK